MLNKRAKKFANVVTINIFEIYKETVAVVVDFQITVTQNSDCNQTLLKRSKIQNLVPVRNYLIV